MKKLLLMSCLFLTSLGAWADDVEKIDASKIAKITFSGDNVTITYNDGTAAATVDMETIVLDFSNVTGIEERLAETRKAGVEGKAVYNLSGQWVGSSAANLPQGIYIINGKKVIIK